MLLSVRDLRVRFDTPAGPAHVVDGVSFDLPAGQTLALVGESGCGKTMTALSILKLVPAPGRIVGGTVSFDGRDLLTLPARQLRALRGNRIGFVFQEPMTSLNPLMTIGQQVSEVIRVHRRLPRRAAGALCVDLLRRVGLPAAGARLRDYPHQLSGGMRQRVLIAIALACAPDLLIADEPSTALDVTVQAQILALLDDLRRETGLAMLLISHDLGVVRRVADAVAVMYAGRIVEHAPTLDLLRNPMHPYTRGLLRATPRLPSQMCLSMPRARLDVIPGEVPDPGNPPAGCPFHPRCLLAGDDPRCRTAQPPRLPVAPARTCACWQAPGYTVPDGVRTPNALNPASR